MKEETLVPFSSSAAVSHSFSRLPFHYPSSPQIPYKLIVRPSRFLNAILAKLSNLPKMLYIHRLRESRRKTASKSKPLYNSRTNPNTRKQGFTLSGYAHTPMVNYSMSRIELHTIDEYFPTHRFFYTELSESPNLESYAHLYPSGVSPYYSQGLICIDPFCACHSAPLGTVHPREDLIPTDAGKLFCVPSICNTFISSLVYLHPNFTHDFERLKCFKIYLFQKWDVTRSNKYTPNILERMPSIVVSRKLVSLMRDDRKMKKTWPMYKSVRAATFVRNINTVL
ncbi:hypothetical protein CROQUDRAFT_665782 [Cronartium quercuum f. sp. fusiforme G11]|uniref:Uncharacterized protein n=1 Tax=Cronartium quercuum f. sp. fusiforme G11 TaxID=708437 RepID=A0A9P6T706_9BASI|nr:hypothetical protein CROQUDRAFT_665782 [Cronartium quercuum f. sp. fusiforme G11]